MVSIVEQYAKGLGLAATVVDVGDATGPLLHVTNRAAHDTRDGLLILGHLDTVHPIGTILQNPCRIENDRLYGPGGYDMKAGAYLAVSALGRVSKQGATALPVDILLVPDEEVGDQVMIAIQMHSLDAFDPVAFDAFLAEQSDLGTKWSPRYVRVTTALPITQTSKVLKRQLRGERWECDEPVYWRPTKYEPLRRMTAVDRAALRAAFAARDRLGELDKI